MSCSACSWVVLLTHLAATLIAVPSAAAQDTARRLCRAGVVGLLNFAPTHVWVPPHVYIENLDLSMALEKVAFFAGLRAPQKEISS